VKIGWRLTWAFCSDHTVNAVSGGTAGPAAYTPPVSRASIERRLLDVSDRIKKATADLAVTDEQLEFLDEEAEDARLRAIVAETPLEVATANEAARHADALRKHRDTLVHTIAELRADQDALLDRLTTEPAPR
jgi:hypothetical protein